MTISYSHIYKGLMMISFFLVRLSLSRANKINVTICIICRWDHLGWNHTEHHPYIWALAGNSIWYSSHNGTVFHNWMFNVQHPFSREKVGPIISTRKFIKFIIVIPSFHRIVKISSPSLNYFIILGAFLMYSSVYFFLIPSLNPVVVLTGCLVG